MGVVHGLGDQCFVHNLLFRITDELAVYRLRF